MIPAEYAVDCARSAKARMIGSLVQRSLYLSLFHNLSVSLLKILQGGRSHSAFMPAFFDLLQLAVIQDTAERFFHPVAEIVAVTFPMNLHSGI